MQLTRPSCDCRYYLGTTSFHRSINRPSCVNISSLADHSFTFVSHSPSSRFDTFLPSNRLWNRFLPPKPPHALLVIQLRVQSFRFDSDRVIVSRNRRRSSFIIDEINQTDEKWSFDVRMIDTRLTLGMQTDTTIHCNGSFNDGPSVYWDRYGFVRRKPIWTDQN